MDVVLLGAGRRKAERERELRRQPVRELRVCVRIWRIGRALRVDGLLGRGAEATAAAAAAAAAATTARRRAGRKDGQIVPGLVGIGEVHVRIAEDLVAVERLAVVGVCRIRIRIVVGIVAVGIEAVDVAVGVGAVHVRIWIVAVISSGVQTYANGRDCEEIGGEEDKERRVESMWDDREQMGKKERKRTKGRQSEESAKFEKDMGKRRRKRKEREREIDRQ